MPPVLLGRPRAVGRVRQNDATTTLFCIPGGIFGRLSHDMTVEPGGLGAFVTHPGVPPTNSGSSVGVEIGGTGVLHNRFAASSKDGKQ